MNLRKLLILCGYIFPALVIFPLAGQAQTKALCHFFHYQKPDDPVMSPDYKPGVDVYGESVVPADISGAGHKSLPDAYRFAVTIDLAEDLDLSLPTGTEMDMPVGMIEIYRDGQVLYNEQDITSRIHELCAKNKVQNPEKGVSEPGANNKNSLKKEERRE